MSAAQRLKWLIAEIHLGRSAFVSFSYNVQTLKEKIKFTLQDCYTSSCQYRPGVMAALTSVQLAFEHSIVTDKGHKSKSTSHTIVEFWIQQVRDSATTGTSCAQVSATSGEDAPSHFPSGVEVYPATTLREELEAVAANLERPSALDDHTTILHQYAQLQDSIQQLHSIVCECKTALPEEQRRPFLARSAAIMGRSKKLDINLMHQNPSDFRDVVAMYDSLQTDVREAIKSVHTANLQSDSAATSEEQFQLASMSQRGMPTPKRKRRRK